MSNDNPFAVPETDEDLKSMHATQTLKEKELRQSLRSMSLAKRTSNFTKPDNTHRIVEHVEEKKTALQELEDAKRARDPALEALTLAARDNRVEQQQLSDFVTQKREMFMLRFSLNVKKQEMSKLDNKAQTEADALQYAEQDLEREAYEFDRFLRTNDEEATKSIRKAEVAEQERKECVMKIKKAEADIMAFQGEITKQEAQLIKLRQFRTFLWDLSPSDWKTEHPESSPPIISTSSSKTSATLSNRRPKPPSSSTKKSATLHASSARRQKSAMSTVQDDTSQQQGLIVQDVDPVVYFQSADDFLQLFRQLEEENLSLIQNGQETEETLHDLQMKMSTEMEKLDADFNFYEKQIEQLVQEINTTQEEATDLKRRCTFFAATGEDEQEKELQSVGKKVEAVYSHCIGENDAGISSLQMLTNIENKLEELFEKIQSMPAEVVAEAEKAKEKQRRQRIREEKLAAQKRHQEERMRKALERAQMEPKKNVGKRVVFRSQPPPKKRTNGVSRKEKQAQEDDLNYFFS